MQVRWINSKTGPGNRICCQMETKNTVKEMKYKEEEEYEKRRIAKGEIAMG